jgi:heat shock protein HslJ
MNRVGRASNALGRVAVGIDFSATALAAGLILAGCAQDEPSQRQLTVAPDPVDCADGTPSACIRVTDDAGDIWITHAGEITGFTYEPGFAYQLLVEDPSELSEAESGDVVKPTLIRVLSKTASGTSAQTLSNRLDQGEWLLVTVSPSDYTAAQWAASRITAKFDLGAGRMSGFAGCNDYFASLAVTGEQIQVSAPGATRKACTTETAMELEQEYLTRIAKASAFVVTPGRLELSLSDGSGMEFRSAAAPPHAAAPPAVAAPPHAAK